MTTRLRPYAGPGLAHFVSTLVVCGVAALVLAPSPCGASVAMEESVITADSNQPSAEHAWTEIAVAPDPPDSSDDDDGGDDAPTASSGIVPVGCQERGAYRECWRLSQADIVSWSNHTADGHSLRGPPRADGDAFNVDDDDDDDASVFSPRSAANHPPVLPPFHFQFDPLVRRASDSPWLRAP